MKTPDGDLPEQEGDASKFLSGPLNRRAALGRLGGMVVATGLTAEVHAKNDQDLDEDDDDLLRSPRHYGEKGRPAALPPGYRSQGLPREKHTATRIYGKGILVAGGDHHGVLSSAEIYEPRHERWRDAASLNIPRSGHAAVLLKDGRVLVIGGFYFNALSSAEIYNPRTDEWSPAASMNVPRYGHTAVRVAGNRVLVFGGHYDGGLSSVEEYDVSSDTWTVI